MAVEVQTSFDNHSLDCLGNRSLTSIMKDLNKLDHLCWEMVENKSTVECCYNTVQFMVILDSLLWWLWQNLKKSHFRLTKDTSYLALIGGVMGCQKLRIFEKIDGIIMTPHCIQHKKYSQRTSQLSDFAIITEIYQDHYWPCWWKSTFYKLIPHTKIL